MACQSIKLELNKLRSQSKKQQQDFNQVIRYLIEQGAHVNATLTQGNETPLFLAVLYEKVSIVRALLQVPGINFNIKGKYQDVMLTPLELARMLFEKAKHDHLHISVYFNYQEIIDVLERADQAHVQSVKEVTALVGALSPRLGAGSPARTLTPEDIQYIQKMLEQDKYKELMRRYKEYRHKIKNMI